MPRNWRCRPAALLLCCLLVLGSRFPLCPARQPCPIRPLCMRIFDSGAGLCRTVEYLYSADGSPAGVRLYLPM